VDELLLIARSLTERLKSLPPSSYTWKFPLMPNDEQLKLYMSFQVSVTVNLGVFSCPHPLKVATVRAVAAAGVADADVEATGDGEDVGDGELECELGKTPDDAVDWEPDAGPDPVGESFMKKPMMAIIIAVTPAVSQ
jgi:hypothetical protein